MIKPRNRKTLSFLLSLKPTTISIRGQIRDYEGHQPTNDWMRWRPKPKWPNADYGIEAIRREAEMELDEH